MTSYNMIYNHTFQTLTVRPRLRRARRGLARGAGDMAIYRSSTERCVPHPVYIGFPLPVPPRRCPGWLSSVPWKTNWTVFSWAHRPAAVLGASTRRHPIPLHRAPPRPAPPRPRRPPRRCAPPRFVLPVVCPGFGIDRYLYAPTRTSRMVGIGILGLEIRNLAVVEQIEILSVGYPFFGCPLSAAIWM